MTERRESIALSGRLTVSEVPAVHARWHDRFADGDPPEQVDLAAVESVDSSALALLLEWRALAGRSVRFNAPPESLATIARLTGVSTLLGWSGANGGDKPEPVR